MSFFHYVEQILYYPAQICTILNPFLLFFATCCWIKLYLVTNKKMSQNEMRQYCLEQQIDYLINNHEVDKEYIEILRNAYRNLGGNS